MSTAWTTASVYLTIPALGPSQQPKKRKVKESLEPPVIVENGSCMADVHVNCAVDVNSHAKTESHITRGNLGESFHLPWPSSDREAIKSLIFYTCSCVPGYWCYLCVHASHSAPRSVRSAQLYKDLVRGVCICQRSVCKLINEVPCAHLSGRCKQRNCSRSGELHRSSRVPVKMASGPGQAFILGDIVVLFVSFGLVLCVCVWPRWLPLTTGHIAGFLLC